MVLTVQPLMYIGSIRSYSRPGVSLGSVQQYHVRWYKSHHEGKDYAKERGVGGEGRWCGRRGKVVWEEREDGVGGEGRWCGRRGKVVGEEREGGVVGEGIKVVWEEREGGVTGVGDGRSLPKASLPTIIRLTISASRLSSLVTQLSLTGNLVQLRQKY